MASTRSGEPATRTGAPRQLTAVVVGGGVGGLAVAGALARTGWRVTLLERAERLRAEPTALLLWPGGIRALHQLGLGHGLDAISTPTPDPGTRHPDGRWLEPPPDPAGGPPPLLVHAQDLHDALMAGLGESVDVRTGTPVRQADPGGDGGPAVTDGRTVWRADLVVAADGVDSALRSRVAPGSVAVSAGATSWRALIPWYRAPELPTDFRSSATDGGRYQFFTAPLGQRGATGAASRGGRYWRATVPGAPRPEPPATQLGLLRRWFDGWHAPIGELLAATDPADLVQRELRTLRPAPDRHTRTHGAGALVLLGDAGHLLPEYLGQGACLALEDAATLVGLVAEAAPGGPLHAATAGYDAARRARVAEVRRRSGKLAATGPLGRLAPVRARRRARAAAAAATWQPPAG